MRASLTRQHLGEVLVAAAPRHRPANAVAGRLCSLPPGLDAYELDGLFAEERAEDADRIRPSAHARHHTRRQTALALVELRARLVADHALQVAHERGVG